MLVTINGSLIVTRHEEYIEKVILKKKEFIAISYAQFYSELKLLKRLTVTAHFVIYQLTQD